MRCDICNEEMRVGSKYGVCKRNAECKLEYQRRWREANPDYASEYGQRWYEANQQRIRENQRQAHEKNAHAELVYLVWSPSLRLHKIGITVNTVKRMQALRNGCPDVVLITTFPYGKNLEKWLHRKFRANRIDRTEWFSDLTEVDVKNAVAEYERALR